MLKDTITPIDRIKGQQYAIFGNSTMMLINKIILGAFMVLYATDVLGFSAKKIAAVMAMVPLVAMMRLPLFSLFKKLPKTKIIRIGEITCIFAILLLIIIPSTYMSFYLFVFLVLFYCFANRVGIMTIWQPLLKDITTDNDRGRFFGRMRLVIQSVSTFIILIISLFIGSDITELQYKALLGIALFGHINHAFWVSKIPELFEPQDNSVKKNAFQGVKDFFAIIKKSKALRLPLIITVLGIPMLMISYIVYLKKAINLPSNFASLYVLFNGLGGGIGLIFWGKITDTLGFKPVKIGLRLFFIAFVFINLFISPFSDGIVEWTDMNQTEMYSFLLICLFGIILGLIVSGVNLAWITLMHYNVNSKNSIEEITAFTSFFNIIWAIEIFTSGFIIDEFAVPSGGWEVVKGFIYLDHYKLYLFLAVVPAQIIGIYLLTKIKDSRPYFGLFDFFSSLTPLSMRTMAFQRNIYNQDEDKRMETAYRLGSNITPVGIDPMTELLSDTSYDVKVCAIMGLAHSKSDLAGEKLLEILNDEERLQIADHVAWALGELRYKPAYDSLVEKLDPIYSSRIRAMAARALGKIGDREAIKEIGKVFENKNERPHLLSSACKALLRLKDASHAAEYFEVLDIIDDREDRYEIIDELCVVLGIDHGWLLKYTSDSKVSVALKHYISLQPLKWREGRHEIIDALDKLDYAKVTELFAKECEKEEYKDNIILQELKKDLLSADKWLPGTSLAAAWLLLKND